MSSTYPDTALEFETLTTGLELLVKVYDDHHDQFAALGLDLQALHGAAFAVGAAELAIAYAYFVQFGEALAGFEPEMLRELDNQIRERKVAERTWADLALDDGDFWYRTLRMQFAMREGGLEAVGRGEIIRAEIVELYRENPSVKKIIATGSLLGLGFLGMTFAAVQLQKQHGEAQCRAVALDRANHEIEMIGKMARLQGQFTENHLAAFKAVENSYKASVAACGSSLKSVEVEVDPAAGKIVLKVGPGSEGLTQGEGGH